MFDRKKEKKVCLMKEKQINFDNAKQIGVALGINWVKFGVEQFWMGLEVELEHGVRGR